MVVRCGGQGVQVKAGARPRRKASTPIGRSEPVRDVTAARLRELVGEGHFASGSMGPKTEALLRFVEQGGQRAVVTTLDRLDQAVDGRTGTSVTA